MTTYTVRTLSPYKDYSSLLRWQANICVHIATTELRQRRYVVVLRVLDLFYCWWPYFVVCGFNRTISAVNVLFYCLWKFWCLSLACRTCSRYESTSLLGAWVGTKVLDPLRVCVKVTDYYDPSSAGTLTCVKSLETFCESNYATVSEWFAIAGHFFCFGEDG
jgi:hypothetical protein